MFPNRLVLAVVAAVTAIGLGVTWALVHEQRPATAEAPSGAHATVDPLAAAKTAFPGLPTPTGEPTLPGLRDTHPSPGTVVPIAGPFDDRFELIRLQLTSQSVTGIVTITSDVSDLLELQVLAGFYDERGNYLSSRRFVHHLEEEGHHHSGPPSEREQFSIQIPQRLLDRVSSATVGVPVLVNE